MNRTNTNRKIQSGRYTSEKYRSVNKSWKIQIGNIVRKCNPENKTRKIIYLGNTVREAQVLDNSTNLNQQIQIWKIQIGEI